MPRLIPISGKKVIKKLQSIGFEETHQRGSHVYLKHPDGRIVTVPVHCSKDVPVGTLQSIVTKQALLNIDYFNKLK